VKGIPREDYIFPTFLVNFINCWDLLQNCYSNCNMELLERQLYWISWQQMFQKKKWKAIQFYSQ